MINPILNLGNNKWAIKENNILGHTLYNNNYIAEEFVFNRATLSRVLNKEGIIEDSCYNMFQFSEDFTQSQWNKIAITLLGSTNINPFGVISSFYLLDDSTNSNHGIFQQINNNSGTTYTSTFYVKKAEHDWVQFYIGTAFPSDSWVNFNLTTGLFGNKGTGNLINTVTILPNGWYKIVLTSTAISNTLSSHGYLVSTNNTNPSSGTQVIYIGLGTRIVELAATQLEIGVVSRPYLKTTNRLNIPKIDFTSNDTVRRNLIKYSQEFDNSVWVKSNGTIISNSIIAPNGSLSADKFLTTASTSSLVQNSVPTSIGNKFTVQTNFKKDSGSYIRFVVITGSKTYRVFFNIDSGFFDSDESTGGLTENINIVNKGDGWFLCSYSFIADSTLSTFYVNSTNSVHSNPVSGDSFYIWGAQLESGTAPSIYQPTTLSLINLSSTPALLIEPQRTNLALHSETFTNGVWVKTNSTISLNNNLNPFGVNKSYYLIDDSSLTNSHLIVQAISLTSGITYTASCYIKKADDTWCQLTMGTNAFGVNTWKNFNFDTGTFGNGGTTGIWSIKQLANGYFLISVIDTATLTGSNSGIAIVGTNNTNFATRLPFYAGTNRRVCDIAAIQFEVGSNVTTYVPTTTVAVQRNGDTNYHDLSGKTLFNRTNFTLFWEGYLYDGSGTGISLALSDTNTATSPSNQIGWFDSIRPFYNVTGTTTLGTTTTTANTFNRFAVQYSAGTANFYKNGNNVFSGQTVPTFDYRYLVLNDGNSTFTTNNVALYNTSLTHGECRALTDIDALAFITAANINNTTQQLAITTLVSDLKINNIWDKFQAIYPFVGGTSFSHKFNLKDPRDLDGAFRLVFNGTWEHTVTGVKPDGTTAYADTKYSPLGQMNLSGGTIGYYSRTNTFTTSIDMGSNGFAGTSGYLILTVGYNGGHYLANYFNADPNNVGNITGRTSSTTGLFTAIRTSNLASKVYQNSTIVINATNFPSNVLNSHNIYLGSRNSNGSSIDKSRRELAFAFMGSLSLTDSEAIIFNTIVQQYQTTLNRQV